MVHIFLLSFLSFVPNLSHCLWCYECVSTQPGCGTPFDSDWQETIACDAPEDKCVKITEQKGASEVITRNCLSQVSVTRRDVPADHYEGCRKAAKDLQLAHFVQNSFKELDIRRDYYDNVTWCFCEFDNYCNKGSQVVGFAFLLLFTTAASKFLITILGNC